jgi:GT2 family glycosyltransferase
MTLVTPGESAAPSVLVLTPVKQARRHLDRYFANLARLVHPSDRLSLGLLEGDSNDGTYEELERRLPALRDRYRRVTLAKHDHGFALPAGVPRWAPPLQLARRSVMARARNRLLFAALRDEEWVLWMDVDLESYPADVLEQLLAASRDIVVPHCVVAGSGNTFDRNTWRDQGRLRMDALRGQGLVRVDAVGGTMLLIRADLHREGLIFPPYLYGRQSRYARDPSPLTGGRGVGEVETEGLGIMAKDMGHECWALADLEIVHVDE